jgi:hypothetical protein
MHTPALHDAVAQLAGVVGGRRDTQSASVAQLPVASGFAASAEASGLEALPDALEQPVAATSAGMLHTRRRVYALRREVEGRKFMPSYRPAGGGVARKM